jgi:hypothetical protein
VPEQAQRLPLAGARQEPYHAAVRGRLPGRVVQQAPGPVHGRGRIPCPLGLLIQAGERAHQQGLRVFPLGEQPGFERRRMGDAEAGQEVTLVQRHRRGQARGSGRRGLLHRRLQFGQVEPDGPIRRLTVYGQARTSLSCSEAGTRGARRAIG